MKVISQFQHEDIQAFRFGYSPIGKPSMNVHIFFIDGLLVDTGQPNMSKEIFSNVSSLPVQQIFITHYHEDHTGNVEMLANHFNCPVYSTQACADIMKEIKPTNWAQKDSLGRLSTLFWVHNLQRKLLKHQILSFRLSQFRVMPRTW